MEHIKIIQVRSLIKRPKKQKNTFMALGLGRISRSVVLKATPHILGMVNKVNHLVRVEYI